MRADEKFTFTNLFQTCLHFNLNNEHGNINHIYNVAETASRQPKQLIQTVLPVQKWSPMEVQLVICLLLANRISQAEIHQEVVTGTPYIHRKIFQGVSHPCHELKSGHVSVTDSP
jgi:hypothetical protein